MRRILLATMFCLFCAASSQADPFVILPNGEFAFNIPLTTQGTFTCTLCTGSGTNSVTFGSGGNTLTLTFTGVTADILVSGQSQPLTLGQFQVTATGSGFVFPAPPNSNTPLVTFDLGISQGPPNSGGNGITYFAFGGGTSLSFSPFGSFDRSVPILQNPPGSNFTFIVYTLTPITIPNTSGTVPLNASVAAVPEPASMLLLSSGVGLMLSLRRKRRRE
ncbi:MAG TPA: PEP-CTERM sorting domain-containing protein [Pyrinomonadaceae bacterium]|nr:PEP-CTERM sorting domain-containing protein [Pyrinomonadaceae bacterium]